MCNTIINKITNVKNFWDPKGFELDARGKKKYLRASDGDTSSVSVSIRMLSIDTPEVHYPGKQKPSKQDEINKKMVAIVRIISVQLDKSSAISILHA